MPECIRNPADKQAAATNHPFVAAVSI